MDENPLTEEEFIRQAKLDWEDNEINTLKDALEACYMNGSYDDVSGDAEAPTGHFYAIERWVVTTDNQGHSEVHTFESAEEAEDFFNKLEEEFIEWDDDDAV